MDVICGFSLCAHQDINSKVEAAHGGGTSVEDTTIYDNTDNGESTEILFPVGFESHVADVLVSKMEDVAVPVALEVAAATANRGLPVALENTDTLKEMGRIKAENERVLKEYMEMKARMEEMQQQIAAAASASRRDEVAALMKKRAEEKKRGRIPAKAEGNSKKGHAKAAGKVGNKKKTQSKKARVYETVVELPGFVESFDTAESNVVSLGNATTETEQTDEMEVNEELGEEDDDVIMELSDDESVGEVGRIWDGYITANKICELKITYVKNKKREDFLVTAADAVQDDPTGKVLKWIVENRMNEPLWRDQVTERILKKKDDEFYPDWVDWETYVREGVEKGRFKKKCLSIFPGEVQPKKGRGRKGYDLEIAESPLKSPARPPCVGAHYFIEETIKTNATRGGGNWLDDVRCKGYTKECGREFVANMCEADCTEKACVIGLRNPAFWCKHCHITLCLPCHTEYLDGPLVRVRGKQIKFS